MYSKNSRIRNAGNGPRVWFLSTTPNEHLRFLASRLGMRLFHAKFKHFLRENANFLPLWRVICNDMFPHGFIHCKIEFKYKIFVWRCQNKKREAAEPESRFLANFCQFETSVSYWWRFLFVSFYCICQNLKSRCLSQNENRGSPRVWTMISLICYRFIAGL